MKMKRFLSMVLTVLLFFSAAGCGAEKNAESESGTVLTVAVPKDENTLSPFTYVSATGLTVNRLVYDTLLTSDLENNVVPWMVEPDYKAENNQIFTFRLLPGQKFHNGEPVNAEAVRFSFTYPADKNNSSQRKACSAIASIETPDELTVKFTLKEPDVNFLRDGFAAIRIICPSVYEGVQDPTMVTESVGSGMYRLAEYKTGEYYRLEAVHDYFKGRPTADRLNMPIMGDSVAVQQAMLAGELAASVGTIGIEMVDVFSQQKNMQVFSNAGFGTLMVNMNCGREPFDDVNFRKAVSMAVDVDGICKTLYGDYALPGTPGGIRSDLSYAIDTEYSYDPEKAGMLLDDLGYTEIGPDGIRLKPDGNPLSVEMIVYSGNPIRSRLAELMKEQLLKTGIDLQILSMDMDTADAYIWPDFEVANGRDYDMCAWGWGSSNTYSYLVDLCHSDPAVGNQNVCGYQSERLDAIIDDRQIASVQDMEEMLKDLQEIISEEVPFLTIAFADQLQVCNTALYDGWKSGKDTNVVNIYSFLAQ